jgi:hypothetical protein
LQRFPIAFQAAFATASLVLMLLLPDTPRWYYAKGRNMERDAVLSRLHEKPIDHPDVMFQRREIFASIKLEEDVNRFRISSLIWNSTDLRAAAESVLNSVYWPSSK